ncbi:MAG: universal stress protein [Acidobacteriota bacterium]|nr:universal stress protein [Acidobacteriota bacterium]
MDRSKEFRVLIASDGSLSATAAVVSAQRFPWPEGTRAFGVVAREPASPQLRPASRATFDRASKAIAENTATALQGRWPGVRVGLVQGPAVGAIVKRAAAVHADVIVLGWRGHGPIRRLLAGSVSRGVVRSAPCSVLVVRRAMTGVRTVVIGFDGSAPAKRAVAMVARLRPPVNGRVLLVTAAETMRTTSNALLPSDVRGEVAAEVARVNRLTIATARAHLGAAARTLRAAGWKTQLRVTEMGPLRSVLAAVTETDADLLVVGARGVTGLKRILLGSVAEGSLDRCSVPVLIVR